MVDAVLHQEMLLGSRRNKLHVLRWIYAGWLIVQVFYLYFIRFEAEVYTPQPATAWSSAFPYHQQPVYASPPEMVGRWFTETFVTQQMILLLLVTPAFVAGAITDEKRRGTLQYLLTTDLESRHIILGKLLGRVAQVALLLLAGMPLFWCLAGFAGVSAVALLASVLVLVVPLLALGSATILASVWCQQTRDAVLGLYFLGFLGALLVWLVGGPLRYFDPYYVLEPAWGPLAGADLVELSRRLVLSSAIWAGLGAACLATAVWRLRPAYIKDLEQVRPSGLGWLSPARPPVDDQPVRWRERNVEGLAPLHSLRAVPRWLAICLIVAATAGSSTLICLVYLAPGKSLTDVFRMLITRPWDLDGFVPDADIGFLIQSVVVVLLASLVVGIRCSGAITGERERKTYESLMLTPQTADELVQGKLWGIMGASHHYLLAYGLTALPLSLLAGPLAAFYTLLGLGVTVLTMYFVGAAGIWCSVKSKSSWRSLLSTLGLGYVAGSFIYLLTTPLIVILAKLLEMALYLADPVLGTAIGPLATRGFGVTSLPLYFVASCVGLGFAFLWMSRQFLNYAKRWIADRDRTRHWADEPIYRRPKRPVAGKVT